jgi:hypothetical protein
VIAEVPLSNNHKQGESLTSWEALFDTRHVEHSRLLLLCEREGKYSFGATLTASTTSVASITLQVCMHEIAGQHEVQQQQC